MANDERSAGADGAPAGAAEAQPGTLAQRAASGSVWVVVGYGAAQVIRFGSNLVLTRLLFPRAFGLVLLLNVAIQGLQMFSDLGVGTSIVQNKRSDRAFLDTAWTIQVVRGVGLWLVTVVLAWPFSQLYGEPELLWMLPVAGATAVIDGFASTKLHTANRGLRLARLQMFELAAQVAAITVMIVASWATRSVWSLVAGMLTATAVRTAVSHLFLPGRRNRFHWERGAAASLLHFGKWVFVSSIVTFLAQQGDRLLFGKMLPISRLGVYNIALTLCDAPSALLGAIAFRVFFPLFSELRRSTPSVDDAYRRASSALALIGGAGALVLVVAGPFLTSLLYDDRYAEASWIIRLLALGIWGNGLVHFTASVVLSGGHMKWLAVANAARLVWLVITVPLAFRQGGFEAALVALVLSDLPRYIALGLACRQDGLHIFRSDAWRTAAFGAAAAAGLFVLQATGTGATAVVVALAVSELLWIAGNRQALRWYLGKARAMLAGRRVKAVA